MGRIPSLKLAPGTRIGNYQVEQRIGRGWEGEVYEVREVPTEAPRAMKIMPFDPPLDPADDRRTVRDYVHYAWFFEQLAATGSVARYYSMFHHFLMEGSAGYRDNGVFCFVFERILGGTLTDYVRRNTKRPGYDPTTLSQRIASRIAGVHREGYALGDMNGENILIRDRDGSPDPVFCDCDPGVADKPNRDFEGDIGEFRGIVGELVSKRDARYRDIVAEIDRAEQSRDKRKVFVGLADNLAGLV